MGSPVSPKVSNPYMKDVEGRALFTLTGTAPSHWVRYVDKNGFKIMAGEE